jgi:hypothetical protein
MASTGKDALWSSLFASSDCQLANLKLMRGDSQDITTQELREEVHSALMQVKTGTSDAFADFPEETPGFRINLAHLAATL